MQCDNLGGLHTNPRVQICKTCVSKVKERLNQQGLSQMAALCNLVRCGSESARFTIRYTSVPVHSACV
jgi:hypothetical protein